MITTKANGEIFYKEEKVSIKPCFPEAHPEKYISLINSAGKELHFIEDLKNYNKDEATIIVNALSQSSKRMLIKEIKQIEEEIELRVFHIATESGRTVFYTRLEDWPKATKDGKFTIRDIHGDDYLLDCKILTQREIKQVAPLLF